MKMENMVKMEKMMQVVIVVTEFMGTLGYK